MIIEQGPSKEKKMENYLLNNGVEIPKIGFGTWQLKGEDCYKATLCALKCGYTHIDTAYAYENEWEIARAIKDSAIDRKKLFLTSKLPAQIKTYEETRKYFFETLKNLNTDYLDLYLIHAPWPWNEMGKDCMEGNVLAYKAMIDLYKEGYIRSIGISNFHPEEIEYLIEKTSFVPQVNQIRYYVSNIQKETTEYCKENKILIEAYSPLSTGKLLEKKEILSLAEKYHITPAKLCLSYCLEKGVLPLVKSKTEERIKENLDIFDAQIKKDDIDLLDGLEYIDLRKDCRF